jgi:hypothetical protein
MFGFKISRADMRFCRLSIFHDGRTLLPKKGWSAPRFTGHVGLFYLTLMNCRGEAIMSAEWGWISCSPRSIRRAGALFGRPERGIWRTSPVSSSTCRYSLDVSLCLSLSACRLSIEMWGRSLFRHGAANTFVVCRPSTSTILGTLRTLCVAHDDWARFHRRFPLPERWCN